MNNLKNQQGLAMGSLFAILFVIGIFATAAIKLVPMYSTNNTVKNSFSEMKDIYANEDMNDVSNKAIRGRMEKFLQINQVFDKNVIEAIEIKRVKGKVLLMCNYELRSPFMSNIEFVVTFENEVDLAER